jgi:hypothetical protein
MSGQPKPLIRSSLTPDEFVYFGFKDAEKPKVASEPQNSDIRLFEENWRYGALHFIRALEAAKIKLVS